MSEGGEPSAPATPGLIPLSYTTPWDAAPQQLATFLAFHQQAADQLGGNELGGAGEETLGEDWESVGGRGGYGGGLVSFR